MQQHTSGWGNVHGAIRQSNNAWDVCYPAPIGHLSRHGRFLSGTAYFGAYYRDDQLSRVSNARLWSAHPAIRP
jgi:hypothetical protein